jgi:hypothetical protein
MRHLISTLVTLTWALWFGALIALFVFVQTLFSNDRDIAVEAAPQLFMAFQKYHLILASIALMCAVAWRISAPSKPALAIFILLGLAACCGVAVSLWIIGPMNALRESGLGGSDEFKRLHGRSMLLFFGQAFFLLISGCLLPVAIRGGASDRAPETSPAANSPA